MGPTSAAEKMQSDVARGRVLIADDDPLMRMDLAEMLTEEGNWPGRCGRVAAR